MQMALMSHLFPEIPLFIVKQYTLDDFAVSIDIDQEFVFDPKWRSRCTDNEAQLKAVQVGVNTLYNDVDRIYIYTKIRPLPGDY